MKSLILAAIAVMSLGLGIASASTLEPGSMHRPNYYNWTAGGGG